MEDLEGQEAAPTTESEISPAKVLVGAEAAAYVQGMRERGEITEWDIPLRSTIDSVTANHRLTRVDYNDKLGHVFHGLPFYEGKSSSNETIEPPAKEKYSAFTKGPWFWSKDGASLYSQDGVGKHILQVTAFDAGLFPFEADKRLIVGAPDLYEACDKAQQFINEFFDCDTLCQEGAPSKTRQVARALAAALTKAGKK